MISLLPVAVSLWAGTAAPTGADSAVALPSSGTATGVQPSQPATAPEAHRPELAVALRSPADPYGIPSGLYALDLQLLSLKNAIEDRARSRRITGYQMVGAGTAMLILSGVLFAVAANNAEEAEAARDNGGVVIHDPSGMQNALAVTNGILGLVSIGYGVSLAGTKPDPEFLRAYYRDTYGGRP